MAISDKKFVAYTRDEGFRVRLSAWCGKHHIGLDVEPDHGRSFVPHIAQSSTLTLIDMTESGQIDPQVAASALTQLGSVALYAGVPEDGIAILSKYPKVSGIIAKDGPFLEAALYDLVNSKSESNTPKKSLADILSSDAMIHSRTVRGTRDKHSYLDEIIETAAEKRAFADFGPMIATVTWELLMNAIYSAPVDRKTHVARYAGVARSEDIDLEPSEYVELCYGSSETAFGVAVTDRFGTLPRKAILESIVRPLVGTGTNQFRGGSHGAGVGYYMIVQSVSMLSLQVVAGKYTTIMALFEQTKRRKEYIRNPPSIIVSFQED